jgi:predicted ribonuclease toxin of YeeF-YezG toxin-antitoxin module
MSAGDPSRSLRGPDGRFIPNPDAGNPGSTYDRPSGYRSGVREKVWNGAMDESGIVRDPLTGQVMDPAEPWHMGHKPGYEFWKHKQNAEQRGITREKFLDEHNNPSHYRPELPSSNSSHAGENHSSDYFGP